MANISVKGINLLSDISVSSKAGVQSYNTGNFDETLNSMRTGKKGSGNEFENISQKNDGVSKTEKFEATGRKNQIKPEDEITDEQIAAASEEVMSQIKELIMDKYDITEEELNVTIENLGLTEEALLDSKGLTQLLMQLEGMESQADMLTNQEFAQNLKEMLAQVDEIKSNVKPEDFQLEQSVEDVPDVNNVTEEDSEVMISQDVSEGTQIAEQSNLGESASAESDNSDEMSRQSERDNKTTDAGENLVVQPLDFAQKLTEDLSVRVGETKAVDIVRQVVEQTQLQVKQGVTSLEMQLYPEHLGKVLVQVVSNEGTITARIATENEAAKMALESQLTLLKENLNNQGVKVENVEVTIASHAFEQNMQGEGQNEQNASHSRKSRRNTDMFFSEAGDDQVEEINESIMEFKGSTVSYTA